MCKATSMKRCAVIRRLAFSPSRCGLAGFPTQWENRRTKKPTHVYRPSEQCKVDKLLVKLVKLQAVSAKQASIVFGQSALKSA
jgi:hypothetical protein